jgi:hypothetical protein
MAVDNAQLSPLVEKATAGDSEAFSEIVRLTQNVVVGYAWSYFATTRARRMRRKRPSSRHVWTSPI